MFYWEDWDYSESSGSVVWSPVGIELWTCLLSLPSLWADGESPPRPASHVFIRVQYKTVCWDLITSVWLYYIQRLTSFVSFWRTFPGAPTSSGSRPTDQDYRGATLLTRSVCICEKTHRRALTRSALLSINYILISQHAGEPAEPQNWLLGFLCEAIIEFLLFFCTRRWTGRRLTWSNT